MKYISIDIETTGLERENPETRCQIIEFAAVIDDLEMPLPLKNLPKFHCYVTHDFYKGEPYALAMHAEKFKKIAEPKKYPNEKFCKNDYLTLDLRQFLETNGYTPNRGGRISITAAGKNFAGFDLQFINKLPMYDKHFNISNMVLDPGSMYVLPNDVKPPDMDTCAKRAGLPEDMFVTHDAMNEALMVVELVRCKIIPGYKPGN